MNLFIDIPEVVSLVSLSSDHPYFKIRTGAGNEFFLQSEKICYASARYGAEIVRVDGESALCMNPSLVATMAKLYWDAERTGRDLTDFLGQDVAIPLMKGAAAAKFLKGVLGRRYPFEPYSRLKNATWINESREVVREPIWVSQWREAERERLSGEIIRHLIAVTDIIEGGFCDGCRGNGGSCMGCCLEDCGPDMIGALVKRATALMEHMPHRNFVSEIKAAKAYVSSRRVFWHGRRPEIEFVKGSVLDPGKLGVEGIAVFLPAGLTAFRWQAKDFVTTKVRRVQVAAGLEYFESGDGDTGPLSRMVYEPNRSNRIYGNREIDVLLDAAFGYFESEGVRSVALNGFRTSGDGARDTVSAVRRWCDRNPRTPICRILLVDKRGDFNRFNHACES